MSDPDCVGRRDRAAVAKTESTQLETWKRKYYDSVEQAEAKERQWAGMEDLLRKTISRLTLAAEGVDEALDKQLRALRDAIRDRVDNKTLQSRIEAMSRILVKLDGERKSGNQGIDGIDAMQRLLEQSKLPRGNARRVKEISRQLDSIEDTATAQAIDQVADLFNEIFAGSEHESEPGGVFGRWFGRKSPARGDEDKAPLSTSVGSENSLEAQREILLHCLDQVDGADAEAVKHLRSQLTNAAVEQELRRRANALMRLAVHTMGRPAEEDARESEAPSVSEYGEPDSAMGGREILLQLLERLGLPETFEPRIEALQQHLENETECDHVDVLREITDMVSEMRSQLQREKQEIEDFLQQLTDRLQDVDSFVNGSEGARKAAYEQSRELGDAVQAQVQGIASDVEDAQDMEALKQTVQLRIDAIVEHVEQHRREEEERNEAADARVKVLQQRLRQMEDEATELRQRVQDQRSKALTDALTGVPNRLAWDERMAQEYARWKRFRTPLAVLVWDVDHFKQINDEYGHKAGDKVLRVIASQLAENIRETDFIARFGGEEFTMLVTGAGVDDVQMVAEKLRDVIERCGFHFRGQAVPITISCGMAVFSEDETVEQVFERADKALYQAKEAGRNRCLMATEA